MARYLITGVAGFIASKVAEFLLDDGHQVVGVDNLNDAYDCTLKEWRLAQVQGRAGFTFHKVDITDRAALAERVFADGHFDGVVNLAARAGVRPSVHNPWMYIDTNVTGTLNLLDLCREHGVEKFVLSSTSSLYGKHNTMPYRETQDVSQPLSPYAASKGAAETLCYTYHYLHNIDITVLRYFTVYGPAGRPDMSPFRFVQWVIEGRPLTVFGDGKQSRDFTYIDDIARGTIAALRPVGFEIVNLGTDTPVVLIEMIHMIERMAGKQANLEFEPRHPADMMTTWADIDKARRLLEWEPEVRFEAGMQRLVDWYLEHREWAKNVSTID